MTTYFCTHVFTRCYCCAVKLKMTNSEAPVNIAQFILGYIPPTTLSHAVWQYEQCMKTTTGGQYTI